jgi:hypothetical protein
LAGEVKIVLIISNCYKKDIQWKGKPPFAWVFITHVNAGNWIHSIHLVTGLRKKIAVSEKGKGKKDIIIK